jgi:hypothetical protein
MPRSGWEKKENTGEYYVIRGFLICRICVRPLVYGKEIKEDKIDEKCRRIKTFN